MYKALMLAGITCFFSAGIASAADVKDPRVYILKVIKKSAGGGRTYLNFIVKATDNRGIKRIEYRAAVDGKQSGWTKFPYYADIVNELPFTVDCDVFTFEVRSVDIARNKSKTAKKTFSGLR